MISNREQTSRIRKMAILSHASSNHYALPASTLLEDTMRQPPDLSGHITVADKACFPAFSGGYGDIWLGIWQKKSKETCQVAVRVLRPRTAKHDLHERYHREVQAWKGLHHANIVPLFGTITNFGPYGSTGIVSPWMQNGNLNNFMGTECIPLLERFQLLSDVVGGLAYLHSQGIIHGDLTGTNILVDEHRTARLIGFGLSAIEAELEGTSTAGAAMRWRAPELLPPMGADLYSFTPTLTLACDIYSFGSVTLQVLSGKVPYPEVKSSDCVLLAMAHGIRPHRPKEANFTDAYWEFISWCWGDAPSSRPCVDEVHRALSAVCEAALDVQPV